MNRQRRVALAKIYETITATSEELEALQEEETEYRDNMPENMQGSERYEAADAAVDAMQEAIDQLSDALDSIGEAQA